MAIPKILHFTWKNDQLPRLGRSILAKWKATHPDWDIRFYDDAAIRALVAEGYPEHLDLFDSYPAGIFRADAFRFFVLHKLGGIYSDLDVDPLRRIDELLDRTECFVGAEPELHVARNEALFRGLPFVLCNAFMGSVPGHPFWRACIDRLAGCNSPDVIDATGPRFTNAVALSIPRHTRPDVLLPNYWSPITGTGAKGRTSKSYVDALAQHFTVIGYEEPPLVSHLWRNSWFKPIAYNGPEFWRLPNILHWTWRKLRRPDLAKTVISAPAIVYQHQLPTASERQPEVSLLLNLSDCVDPKRLADAICALSYPVTKTRLFASGGTEAVFRELQASFVGRDRSIEWIQESALSDVGRINAALEHAAPHSEYCLLISGSVISTPPNAIEELLSANQPVVTAFVTNQDGQDLNGHSFLVASDHFKYLYRNTRATGRVEAPQGPKRYPLAFASHHRVAPLTTVGDRFLLIDSRVVAAGGRFPEDAYKFHAGAMGFALAARDKGFEVCGMPGLKVTVADAKI